MNVQNFRRVTRRFAAAATLAMLAACSPSKPGSFDKLQLHVDYPAGWKPEVQEGAEGPLQYQVVTLTGPKDAVVVITQFVPATGTELKEFVSQVQTERTKFIDKTYIAKSGAGALDAATRNVAGKPLAGLAENYSVKLFGTDVPHHVEYYKLEDSTASTLLMLQASREAWDASQADFGSILASLRVGPVAPAKAN